MKSTHLTWILIALTFGCGSAQKAGTPDQASAAGTYTLYNAAMGSGRGLIFRVAVKNAQDITIIDSFFVGGRYLPFSTTGKEGNYLLEANYLHTIPVPAQMPDGSMAPQGETAPDLLVERKMFYPSWITAHKGIKLIRIPVTSYTEVAQTDN